MQRTGDAVILAISGELDMATAPILERRLRAAEPDPPGELVVDLSGLEFMDSTGLHVLLAAARRLRDSGRQLTLRPGPRSVQRVFELTQTSSQFRFED